MILELIILGFVFIRLLNLILRIKILGVICLIMWRLNDWSFVIVCLLMLCIEMVFLSWNYYWFEGWNGILNCV